MGEKHSQLLLELERGLVNRLMRHVTHSSRNLGKVETRCATRARRSAPTILSKPTRRVDHAPTRPLASSISWSNRWVSTETDALSAV